MDGKRLCLHVYKPSGVEQQLIDIIVLSFVKDLSEPLGPSLAKRDLRRSKVFYRERVKVLPLDTGLGIL